MEHKYFIITNLFVKPLRKMQCAVISDCESLRVRYPSCLNNANANYNATSRSAFGQTYKAFPCTSVIVIWNVHGMFYPIHLYTYSYILKRWILSDDDLLVIDLLYDFIDNAFIFCGKKRMNKQFSQNLFTQFAWDTTYLFLSELITVMI